MASRVELALLKCVIHFGGFRCARTHVYTVNICAVHERPPPPLNAKKKMTLRFIAFYGCLDERRYIYPVHSHQLRSASLLFAMQRNSLYNVYRFHITSVFPSQLNIQFLKFIPRDEKKLYKLRGDIFFHRNIEGFWLVIYLNFEMASTHFFWPNQMNISKIIHAKGFQCETNWM